MVLNPLDTKCVLCKGIYRGTKGVCHACAHKEFFKWMQAYEHPMRQIYNQCKDFQNGFFNRCKSHSSCRGWSLPLKFWHFSLFGKRYMLIGEKGRFRETKEMIQSSSVETLARLKAEGEI